MINLPTKLEINPRWINAIGGIEALDGTRFRVRRRRTYVSTSIYFSRQEKRIMRKRRPMPVSEWAERHRVLPRDAAIPGPWRNQTVPYLAGIMDASFFPSVEEIIVCAAPQTGKTDAVNTCIGYAADRRPGNFLVVYPDEVTARENNKDRIQAMFTDSPRLRSYMTGYADDASALRLNLVHMKVYMAWANSAARLANKPLPYVHLDEEDKYPVTAGKRESSPQDLAKKRTRTFRHMRKIWRTSSPSIEEGPIWKALTEEADIVFDYYVRCPYCGGTQKMVFEQIKWTEGVRDPKKIEAEKSAWYECEKCHAKWDDPARNQAVRSGEWRDREHGRALFPALRSIRPLRIGFHIPAWLSPFVGLYECAAAFLRGLKDKNKLKDFLNGFAAEPWKHVEAVRTEEKILKLRDERPRGVVPGGGQVACLLAGVDTQDNGFWYEIRAFGWGLEYDSWGIREGFVTSFEALEQVLWEDQYKDADGLVYPVKLTCQDAMGHRTADVYRFCQANRGRILPTKGRDVMSQPYRYTNIEYYPGTKKPIKGGLLLVNFDTNYFKNQLSSILDVEKGDPGCWYYHSELTDEWARQMTVEGLNEKGLWENPKGRPNHAWDCSVLLLLAHTILGVQFWPKPDLAEKPIEKPDDALRKTINAGYSRPAWLDNR